MRSMRTPVAVALAVVLLAGCSGNGAPEVVATTTSTPPAPVAVKDVVVAAESPTTIMVLDPVPAGAEVQRVTAGPIEAEATGAGYGPLAAAATLYGEPGLDDPLAGRVLVVGISSGSATIGGPRTDAPGAHEVDLDLDHGLATYVPDGDRDWVLVPADLQDTVYFVVGMGLTEAELVAAAAAADFVAASPAVDAAALPDGLVTLVAGAPGDSPRSWQGEQIELMIGDVLVAVSVVRADPRLATLWGFWTMRDDAVEASPTRRSGPLRGTPAGDDSYGVVWADGGNVVSVVGIGWGLAESGPDVTGPLVNAVADALRPGTSADLAALSELVLEPPTPAELNCPADAPMITGRTGEVRWAFAAAPDPAWNSPLHYCGAVINPVDGLNSHDQILHEDSALPAVGQMIAGVLAAHVTLDRPQHNGYLRAGIAPPGTARVIITAPDLTTQEAVLGGSGPRPGEQLFAAYFPGDWSERLMERAFTAAGFDVNGDFLDDVVLP